MAGLPKYSTAFVGPGASPIGGCDMIGHIAVVTDPSFSSWSSASFVGGLSSFYSGFWVIICDSTTAGVVGRTTGNNTTNPINAPSGFELDYKPTFWVCKKSTDAEFCLLFVNKLPPTLDNNGYNTPTTTPPGGRPYFDGVSPGSTASDAKTWLNQNGYWTSYPS